MNVEKPCRGRVLVLLVLIYVLSLKEYAPNIEVAHSDSIVPPHAQTNNELLVDYGREIGIVSILAGEPNSIIQQAAEEHAKYQANHQLQGHQLWPIRMGKLISQFPQYQFTECANESWENQSIVDAIKEAYRSWKLSSGHWNALNTPCDMYGYSMSLGSNRVWYFCAIFGRHK